jgi:Hg(II)-responsive transcriptional regulator
MKNQEKRTIGVLAKQAGVGVETVRFYERKGFIRRPAGKSSGYREYSADDVKRISFIRRTQELGFTLREIQELLELNADPRATCLDVQAKADLKASEIDAKVDDLRKMRKKLKELARACGSGKKAVSECRILDCFEPGWKCGPPAGCC